MHPIHAVNYMTAILKKTLREYRPSLIQSKQPPQLLRELGYYFTWTTQVREDLNQMLYALCCFSSDGEIIFSHHGAFDVSLWKFRRLGITKTAEKIERTIRVAFKKNLVPLEADNPFDKVGENLYLCNISWFSYNNLIKP